MVQDARLDRVHRRSTVGRSALQFLREDPSRRPGDVVDRRLAPHVLVAAGVPRWPPYSVAFGTLGVDPVVGAISAAVVAGIAVFVWRWIAPHVGDMAVPVITYVVVISVMVVLAFGTFGDGGSWLIPAGATLFFISDLFVARNQFVAPGKVNHLWGRPLYYLAQVLLALSVMD